MAIVKCPNQHYYDNAKYDQCPHCLKMQNGAGSESTRDIDIGENKTIAKFSTPEFSNSGEMKTQSLRNSVRANIDVAQKTVAKYMIDKNINPIAGWLVCTEGENRGRSFEIHIGKNFVGRSMKNDIHINDEKVSRDNHFSVIFEPIAIEFYVLQGKGITYYNGEMLSDAEPLKEGDIIQAGESKYLFVPYCKKGREWDEKQDS